ncbi:MAG: hypothetical protein E5Y77_05115 [Mesorhizobium sp.]|nr:MAG: hypothetical protein E5Y77_05115 [Mesorhizobium sp.]
MAASPQGKACSLSRAFCRTFRTLSGHLPRKGGDWPSQQPSPISNVAGVSGAPKLLISPLAGEMAGRPEGGGKE